MENTLMELGYEPIRSSDWWWRFMANGHECFIHKTQWGRMGSQIYTLKVDGKTVMTGGKLDTCLAKVKKLTGGAQ